ncbi:MAG TPA: LytTR family DNA-binding domain-containing protein [Chitinophagaceae bacterium]|nr:LytTR family DNA-binding domain-containing protein [Chitinophagaceae bacterium]
MEKELIKIKLLQYKPRTSLTVISGGRVVRIIIKDIIRVAKYANNAIIYTMENEYRTLYSLQEIMNDLPVNDFFRVHRSHIVCLNRITKIEKARIRIGDFKVPVTKYYKSLMAKRLREMLESHFLSFACSKERNKEKSSEFEFK